MGDIVMSPKYLLQHKGYVYFGIKNLSIILFHFYFFVHLTFLGNN